MDSGIEKLAKVFKVLGDYNRLGIVMVISKASRTVTEIINATGMSQTLVSFHLRVLRKAEVVTTRREGPFIYYSLANPSLMDIIDELSHVINAGSEMEKILEK
ncbi:MAG TPA: ArsR family transcriptional regulator [Nitrospirae bacterium]|nr:ArsR family transcriptional regulator [Nitrospirota bacterium]HDH06214.1 ArsR family transcriptional regulator [Nitrospirota bacterium]HDY70644.1 ArsR family transcriptional regulator [Nitrospirota bacterium]